MQITFSDDASETFDAMVSQVVGYNVGVLDRDGIERDVRVIKMDTEAQWSGAIVVRVIDAEGEPAGKAFTVLPESIHVY